MKTNLHAAQLRHEFARPLHWPGSPLLGAWSRWQARWLRQSSQDARTRYLAMASDPDDLELRRQAWDTAERALPDRPWM